MQCFICVTYMIILCTAQPTRDRAITRATAHEKRSLFRDVIESLRIRSQLPDEINHNDDNNLSQNYDTYGFNNETPELPSDADFIPRRNDRIEMPTLNYRFPKSIKANGSEIRVENKKEDIIVYVNTPSEILQPKATTHKPEPKPHSKVNFVKQSENDEDISDMTSDLIDANYRPVINKMEDSSQIGNREYQTVIKPTVIVNFRGSVSHRDSEIRLEKRNNPKRKQDLDSARNIFNINQEIKLGRPHETIDIEGLSHMSGAVKQGVNVLSSKVKEKAEAAMTACATAGAHAPESDRSGRDDRDDNILQIAVTL